MAIESNNKYVLIYVACSFEENIGFARNIAKNFGAEVPYVYDDIIESEVRDHFDSYIYIEDNYNFDVVYREICRMYYGMVFTVLGKVSGDQIITMLQKCRVIIRNNIETGVYYQVMSGEYKNLVILAKQVLDDDTVIGNYQVLGEVREIQENIINLRRYENKEYVNFSQKLQLTNLQEKAFTSGEKRAIIVDAYNVLYRNFFNYDKMYTAYDNKFVGGAFGFYFTLLKLKEFYPEYELHVVFDGNKSDCEQLLQNNVHYKINYNNYSKQFWEIFQENKIWALKFARAAGFYCYSFDFPNLQVDHIMGSVTNRLLESDYLLIYIYSNNDNFFQLISDKVKVLLPKDKYKENSHLVDMKEILEKFKVGEVRKINWYRAIKGNRNYGIPSINMYYNNMKADNRVIMSASYMKLIRECDVLDNFINEMKERVPFRQFMEEQFIQNYDIININTGLLKKVDLIQFKRNFDHDKIQELLEKNAFMREVEILERTSKIFQSLW